MHLGEKEEEETEKRMHLINEGAVGEATVGNKFSGVLQMTEVPARDGREST